MEGRTVYAHRLALKLAGQVVPDDMDVDHLCWTPACVRVEHLRVVTHKENGRQWRRHRGAGTRVCGHAWEDTTPGRNGCATCHRESERIRRAKKKSA